MGQEQSGNGHISIGGPNPIRIENGRVEVGGISVTHVTMTHQAESRADGFDGPASAIPALVEHHPGVLAGVIAGGALVTAVTGIALIAALSLPSILYAIPLTLAAVLVVLAIVIGSKRARKETRIDELDLERRLLELASTVGGRLTVTGAARALGISLGQADTVLTQLAKTGYVSIDNDPETGVVIYTFPEIAAGIPDDPSRPRKLT
jgi:hypothetical protein